MRNIMITFITNKQSEIKKFIDKFYDINSDISPTTFRLSYTLETLIETIDIISAIIDNDDSYSIEVFVQTGRNNILKITSKNLETYIRYVINQYIAKNRFIVVFRAFYEHIKTLFSFLYSLN